MQRHIVSLLVVGAFNDVDLAFRGPARPAATKRPARQISERSKCEDSYLQSGPRATDATGHVPELENGQVVRVRLGAGQTHAIAAAAGRNIGGVDAEIDGAVAVGLDVSVALRGALVDVVHITARRVVASEELPVAKEAIAQVVVGKGVPCQRQAGRAEEGKERCTVMHGLRDRGQVGSEGGF